MTNKYLYQTRPQQIEAIQWTGANLAEVKGFLAERFPSLSATASRATDDPDPTMSIDVVEDGLGLPLRRVSVTRLRLLVGLDGVAGWIDVPKDHWIVRDPTDGDMYWPESPERFAERYISVSELDALAQQMADG